MSENSICRRAGETIGTITWPFDRLEWASLPGTVRERVRDLMDEAVDLIEHHALSDIGLQYFKTVTKPRVLTPEDEEKVAALGRDEVRKLALRHEAHAWVAAFGDATPSDEIAEEVQAVRAAAAGLHSELTTVLVCCHGWRAPRVDTVHETVPVNHVCNERKGHKGEHVCSCGAFLA